MSAFLVTVKAEGAAPLIYLAISHSSFDVHAAAVDQHGLCAISVTPAPARSVPQ